MPVPTFTDVQNAISAASDAIAAEEWSTAVRTLLQAQTLLVAVPDQIDGPRQIFFHREQINQLLANARQAQGAAAGIGRSKTDYVNPTT